MQRPLPSVSRRSPAPAAKKGRLRGERGATPMIAQYLALKAKHPDFLLFYRMGDFYEMFFDDAVTAAAALDIALTRRGKHEGRDIPMCGVPVHAADSYLERLIRKGFRMAICEQVEDPAVAKKRGNKALVRREVVRLVTPGTLTEETLLDAQRNNYLAALAEAQGALALAWLDLSTGEFRVETLPPDGLAAALARIEPGEIVASEKLLERPEWFETFAEWKAALSPHPASRFDSEDARARLKRFYRVASLDAFGAFTRAEIAACGALLDYVELTQKGRMPGLRAPVRLAGGATLDLDPATRRNLELNRTLSGERRGSLLSVIDRTVTGAGARRLAERLSAPLTDPAAIGKRLDAVEFFFDSLAVRATVREGLRRSPDAERALSRLLLGRGGPRDVAAVREALMCADSLRGPLEGGGAAGLVALPEEVADCARDLGFHGELTERLARALRPELPLLARDGGFIAKGYNERLDELVTLRDESRRLVANMQGRYAADSGVASLKIRHNNVLGYYVEVTPPHAERMARATDETGAPRFIHRQTLAGAVRYTTVELGELEARIEHAAERALALEMRLFEDLVAEVTARAEAILCTARALARLDVASALAELAEERRYARPVVDDSLAFTIDGGRHPVVEAALQAAQESAFVTNDCDLSTDNRLWLVTGPNMAGKSTFLRQNALIAILAQIGSFVPARAARIGAVDRLFSRVGAADDLARGRSTFMVEMVETAAILNQAGPRSLVILDEIGRGTATFDGLSIAWAAIEHLHEVNRSRTLFATHFHELTALAGTLDGLSCHCVRVKEWRDEVVFLHEVAPGAADRSYGVHVARLAGLPAAVIERAGAVLATLESGEQAGALARLADDLPLFRATPHAFPGKTRAEAAPSPLEAALAELRPDELSPKEALELLYRLKGLLGGGAT